MADPDDDLAALLTLGAVLPDRLVATVAAHWAERLRTPDQDLTTIRPALHAALWGWAAMTIRTWLGRPDLDVDLIMIDEGDDPTLSSTDGTVQARLPFAWLLDVWAHDLTLVMGRFCLAATHADTRWTLTAVTPDLGPPHRVTIDEPTPTRPDHASR
jgi:hypothetical protein